MPGLKLTYFPVRGRGEHIRYILHQTGTPYEEIIILQEDWPKHKANQPLGQLPVLEIDGKQLSQSMAIGRYLAAEHGLAGKTNLERAFADMLCDGVHDIVSATMPFVLPTLAHDMAKREEPYKKFREEPLRTFLTKYTKFLKDNGTGWFVGNAMTWADLTVAEYVDRIETVYGDDIVKKDFKELEEHSRKIHALPKIATYIKNRPYKNELKL